MRKVKLSRTNKFTMGNGAYCHYQLDQMLFFYVYEHWNGIFILFDIRQLKREKKTISFSVSWIFYFSVCVFSSLSNFLLNFTTNQFHRSKRKSSRRRKRREKKNAATEQASHVRWTHHFITPFVYLNNQKIKENATSKLDQPKNESVRKRSRTNK